jgi:hypothetical protein
MDPNLEHAINIKDKFQFYFLALVFTVLGLSIQTSQFTSTWQAVIEVCAWVSLLGSGLAGLSRMEWRPLSYEHYSELTAQKSFLREANTGRPIMDESGELMSPLKAEHFIKDVNDRIKERIAFMDKLDRKGKVKYYMHKWLFVVGLVLIAVSRAVNLFYQSPTSTT